MARLKSALVAAYGPAEVIQTLTGIPANATVDFVLSAKGVQTNMFPVVTSKTLASSFAIAHAWCSAVNGVNVRIANVTGTSAQIGSCSFQVIAL